ncbi:MAG: carbon-nitrogen hydrolase family protein [Burkholderiales bacterium]|nr:carbon-nitrogen hydrolase family protein [Burkholderiales bacterium]
MLKIGTCQMTSGSDRKSNMRIADKLVREAASKGCQLVSLPEMFALMPRDAREALANSEEFGAGPIQDQMSSLAKELGIWLVGGSIPLKSEDPSKVFNSCLVYDNNGNLVARYDKIHLFIYAGTKEKHDEAKLYLAGKNPVSFLFPLEDGKKVKVGLGICYDLRFPEQFRNYDADLLILPSAFTVPTGQAHWEVLLRARAIENLCYVAAPAQTGTNAEGRSFYGHTLAIDGWGTVLDCMSKPETGFIESTVDLDFLSRIREELPALQNRVPL